VCVVSQCGQSVWSVVSARGVDGSGQSVVSLSGQSVWSVLVVLMVVVRQLPRLTPVMN